MQIVWRDVYHFLQFSFIEYAINVKKSLLHSFHSDNFF